MRDLPELPSTFESPPLRSWCSGMMQVAVQASDRLLIAVNSGGHGLGLSSALQSSPVLDPNLSLVQICNSW